jgi:O-antigen/teichoic acid export membrane protein
MKFEHVRIWLAHWLGLDRAIAFTVGAKICSIVGSAGTVLLIVHFLSPVEQGYYYTLLSLVNLQIVFELGFSFVVQQFAAHESVHLTFHSDGQIEGDAIAHARLALVLRKTVKWYFVAALLMGATLLPIGFAFFSHHKEASETVAWHWPLNATILAAMMVFFLDPLLSFLDGCGQVRQVACVRLGQGIMAIAMAWTALVSHHGLYSPAMVIYGNVFVAGVFLWSRRRLLIGLLEHPAPADAISWKDEVWSFQWRIAISWLGSYFTAQVLTPVLFVFSGAAEAGRMGMSLGITGYMWNLVLAWMSTKATPFGQMIARGDYIRLDRIFFRTLWQSLGVLSALAVSCMAGVLLLPHIYPRLGARMLTPAGFVLLLAAAAGQFVIQSEAIYLRAHKYEPFLWLSVVLAILTLTGACLLTPRWGALGAASTYFACTGIIGALSATAIFLRQRSKRHRSELVEVKVANV